MTSELATFEGADAEFEQLLAEAESARVPVARVPWNMQVQSVEDATFVIAAIQQVEAGIEARSHQVQVMNAVAERYVEALKARYGLAIEHVVSGELAGQKTKSLKLVTGVGTEPAKVGFRKTRAKLDVVDAEAVMAWASENCPEAIKVPEPKPYIVKTPLLEHVKATGEVPEGTAYDAGGVDEFYGL
jgi:hypothetical protein